MTELDKLQKIADSQRKEKAKIEGRIESLMEELANSGYDSVDAAKKALKTKKTKLNKMKTFFEKKLAKFKKDYKRVLENAI